MPIHSHLHPVVTLKESGLDRPCKLDNKRYASYGARYEGRIVQVCTRYYTFVRLARCVDIEKDVYHNLQSQCVNWHRLSYSICNVFVASIVFHCIFC